MANDRKTSNRRRGLSASSRAYQDMRNNRAEGALSEAQFQLDTRALEVAVSAQKEIDRLTASLTEVAGGLRDHVKSCTADQKRNFIGIIGLLIGMLAVLINLYVLPHGR